MYIEILNSSDLNDKNLTNCKKLHNDRFPIKLKINSK